MSVSCIEPGLSIIGHVSMQEGDLLTRTLLIPRHKRRCGTNEAQV